VDDVWALVLVTACRYPVRACPSMARPMVGSYVTFLPLLLWGCWYRVALWEILPGEIGFALRARSHCVYEVARCALTYMAAFHCSRETHCAP
jgi:hypothetical protein